MTKRSTEIYQTLQQTLAKVRTLNAELNSFQPLPDHSTWHAKNERQDRLDRLGAEITKSETEKMRFVKEHAAAIAAEQRSPVGGPSEALAALYKQRDGIKRRIDTLRAARSENALAGAEGDKKAKTTLAKAVDDHTAGEIELANLNLAINAAEQRDAEERHEFAARAADAGFQAGIAATDPLVEWAFEADRIEDALAAHYGKLPALRTALMKSGADVNTDMTNRLFIKAANDRSAKAAGLHHVFNIDATVTAARLGDTFKSLLRAAVRRPNILERKAS
jgi:hypothetical protein